MNRQNLAIGLSFVLAAAAAGFAGLALRLELNHNGFASVPSIDFEKRLEDYLLANPQVLIESVQNLQVKEDESQKEEVAAVLRDRRSEIFSSPTSPTIGNTAGDVTVVEFFDYNCPYCHQAAPILANAVKVDNMLKVVLKEFPILSSGSKFAARAALASQKQGKYEDFHNAMMGYEGRLEEGPILEIAKSVAIDTEQLMRDMEDPSITAEIDRNLALAEALEINGTPSFIIGEQIVPGVIDLATLQRAIAEERAKQQE